MPVRERRKWITYVCAKSESLTYISMFLTVLNMSVSILVSFIAIAKDPHEGRV